MSNRLMIRYESDDFTRWSWVSLDMDNKPIGDVLAGDLIALAKDADGKRLALVIAARSLLITSVGLPDGNLKAITSAIPYAMEEQLAEDVDDMHFAPGKRQADGSIPVIAISKIFLSDLLQVLANAGLYPDWAVAEPLLLPWDENGLSILLREHNAIVRDGEMSGYECSIAQLPSLLACSETKKEELHGIRLWSSEGDIDISGLFSEAEDRVTIDQGLSDLECLTEFGQKHPSINILQGFAVLALPHVASGRWRPAIALGIAAILLFMGTTGYQYYYLRQEIQAVTQETEDLFRRTFPDVKRLVQPLVQAQQRLEQRMAANGQSTDALLDLLLLLGEVKQIHSSIEFKNLEYRQNSLVILLEGPSVAQIEKFSQQLESNGNTESDILSTVSKGKMVEARIKIKVRST